MATATCLAAPRQVGYLIVYVTNRCNFRCPFCFLHEDVKAGKKADELTCEEFGKIAASVGPLLQLSITGGEPFLRKDLSAITRLFVKHTHAGFLTIPTNAWFTDRIVAFLEETLPACRGTDFRLVFSIDGIGDEHDRIRAATGSYERILASYEAVSPLREKFDNLVLDANACFSADNEDTLLATIETLARDFTFDNISVTYARGNIQDPALKNVSRQKYARVNECLEQLEKRKERRLLYPFWRGVRDVSREDLMRITFDDEFVVPCVAGRKLVVLRETGEVLPCEILPRTMGNIRDFDYDLKRLLNTPANQRLRQWIRDSKCKCSFECALGANVVWNPSSYGRLLRAAIRNVGKGA